MFTGFLGLETNSIPKMMKYRDFVCGTKRAKMEKEEGELSRRFEREICILILYHLLER